MARIRALKPELLRHEALFMAEKEFGLPLRIAFAGMWTVCDREGRFRWKPRVLKLDVLPFDDLDFSDVLHALEESGFIVRYERDGESYGHIPSWHKHQHVNAREAESTLPAPPKTLQILHQPKHVHAHAKDGACTISSEINDLGVSLRSDDGETTKVQKSTGMHKSKHVHAHENGLNQTNINEINDIAVGRCMHTSEHVHAHGEGKGREGVVGAKTASASRSPTASRFALDRLPDDWRAFCKEKRKDLDPDETFQRFRDYWAGVPGAKGRKADWPATWRNWVRNEKAAVAPGRRAEKPRFNENLPEI